MTGAAVPPHADDSDPDDGKKWDQVLKGEDYDLDADGTVDGDVAVDPAADPATTPSTTEASGTDAPPTSRG